jgi:hypothetical protein
MSPFPAQPSLQPIDKIEMETKRPVHPPFPVMICDSMHAMDAMMKEGKHHGHSLHSIKKYMGDHFKVINILCIVSTKIELLMLPL